MQTLFEYKQALCRSAHLMQALTQAATAGKHIQRAERHTVVQIKLLPAHSSTAAVLQCLRNIHMRLLM